MRTIEARFSIRLVSMFAPGHKRSIAIAIAWLHEPDTTRVVRLAIHECSGLEAINEMLMAGMLFLSV
jgi:hypothetical protein